MKRVYFIILVIISITSSIHAQDVDQQEEESRIYQQLFQQGAAGSNVRIVQEKKLDEILLNFMEQGRKLGGIPCYWIRIYSGSTHSARDEAYETKARFLKKYEVELPSRPFTKEHKYRKKHGYLKVSDVAICLAYIFIMINFLFLIGLLIYIT